MINLVIYTSFSYLGLINTLWSVDKYKNVKNKICNYVILYITLLVVIYIFFRIIFLFCVVGIHYVAYLLKKTLSNILRFFRRLRIYKKS